MFLHVLHAPYTFYLISSLCLLGFDCKTQHKVCKCCSHSFLFFRQDHNTEISPESVNVDDWEIALVSQMTASWRYTMGWPPQCWSFSISSCLLKRSFMQYFLIDISLHTFHLITFPPRNPFKKICPSLRPFFLVQLPCATFACVFGCSFWTDLTCVCVCIGLWVKTVAFILKPGLLSVLCVWLPPPLPQNWHKQFLACKPANLSFFLQKRVASERKRLDFPSSIDRFGSHPWLSYLFHCLTTETKNHVNKKSLIGNSTAIKRQRNDNMNIY